MQYTIFYYTGTENSLWIAKRLRDLLGEMRLESMAQGDRASKNADTDAIGFVFPVHMWGVPRRVIDFVKTLKFDLSRYYFCIAVNAGQVAATNLQMKKLVRAKGGDLKSGFSVLTPSNYIPWGGPGTKEQIKARFIDAEKKLQQIASAVKERRDLPVEKGKLWENLILSGLAYRLAFPNVPKMDGKFWVDDKCNSCGTCETVCPSKNIELRDGKPTWNHRCEQCLACIQWCPRKAMQYGKNTPKYDRYHHPEIKLSEIVKERFEK